VDIHIEEAERRWQIQRAKTKQINESQTGGGMEYEINDEAGVALIPNQGMQFT
jgi:hypothetical protein